MSSSVHEDNKKKDILILGKSPTQGLEHTLTAEKMYLINFTVTKNKFCLSLHYNGVISYKFKAKDSKIVDVPYCNCECECDKACDISEYLDYENCKCRKKLVDKLVDECAETVEEVKLAKITLAENENKYKCKSCTLYIVLFSIRFTINVGIGTYFVYFHWYLKKDVTHVEFDTRTQTMIY